MLGANLRQLSKRAASISALCRELGINRTQYNRYLAGESFPRPDVLHRICSHFNVDARILLEPVEEISNTGGGPFQHPFVTDFLGERASYIPEEELPSGFYRFARRSFMDESKYVQGLIFVSRADGLTLLKGFEAKEAMEQQGLPTQPGTREFRGVALRQDDGIATLLSRRGAATASFNYLARVPSFENNFWVGYVTRTVRENLAGRRVERLVFEYLGARLQDALPVARTAGFCRADDFVPYLRSLLKTDESFS
ncbi:MAG: helix-turn-helix domain-containing protein [Pelagimonas sp.]|nr:helix-turn-helix domain-containing protein [Pelagimonas sp.]